MVMEEQQSDMELDSERIPVPQVQEPTKNPHPESNNKVTSISRGKPRLRKKALHAAILKQMEFYFSDANLRKDRFLGNLIRDNSYVDLSVFVTFNRIRELTTDTNRIAKALQGSTMLSLSKDGMKVCRTTPIMEKENTEECTVYVQNLPPDADHEMLSSIFSQYGSVAYVSVPRYKSSKKIKGFAFIEFDKPEDAVKCIKAFQKKGCVLPSHTPPDELLSITTFDDVEKDVTLKGRVGKPHDNYEITENTHSVQVSGEDTAAYESQMVGNNKEESNANTDKTSEFSENKDKKKVKKRKHKDVEMAEVVDTDSSVTEQQSDAEIGKSKKKKSKHSAEVHDIESMQKSIDEDVQVLNNTQKKLNKHKKSVTRTENEVFDNCEESDQNAIVEDSAMMNSSNEDQENGDDKKKKRKRKRRSKIDDVSFSMGLQVMAKNDWKHLRNKYLELQRSKMKQLKQHLRKARWNQWPNYEKNKPEKEENDEKEKASKQENANAVRFSFTPGVIVKIDMTKPCTDPKSFKIELRGNSSIKYIDVEEDSHAAYIRCDTSEAAQLFAQKSNEERHMTILQGEEEKTYWEKIFNDREDKIGKKVRIKQRGRNKLLKKAEKELGKHIKFDEV